MIDHDFMVQTRANKCFLNVKDPELVYNSVKWPKECVDKKYYVSVGMCSDCIPKTPLQVEIAQQILVLDFLLWRKLMSDAKKETTHKNILMFQNNLLHMKIYAVLT